MDPMGIGSWKTSCTRLFWMPPSAPVLAVRGCCARDNELRSGRWRRKVDGSWGCWWSLQLGGRTWHVHRENMEKEWKRWEHQEKNSDFQMCWQRNCGRISFFLTIEFWETDVLRYMENIQNQLQKARLNLGVVTGEFFGVGRSSRLSILLLGM